IYAVNSDPRSGRPSSTVTPKNIERVRFVTEEDRRLTVRELESDLEIPETRVSILTENLGMTRVFAKFIPKLLTVEQKKLRFAVAQDNLMMKICFKRSIGTGDAKWVSRYDPETKQQSSQWKPKKACQILKRLCDAVRRKRSKFWASGDWLLHHDNAPAHSSNLV
ncbi:hypothetical protein NQ318_009440, partial [Aromia moschata]